jgi:hypothetical protein
MEDYLPKSWYHRRAVAGQKATKSDQEIHER